MTARYSLLAVAATLSSVCAWTEAEAQDGAILLAPHRAVYDLRLAEAKSKQAPAGINGRLVYNFSGNTCEGYTLEFRQLIEIDPPEGQKVVSDVRSTSWEEGQGKELRFSTENLVNFQSVGAAEGRAERRGDNLAVELVKPEPKSVELKSAVFPTEHMRRTIAAARGGQTLLELPLFDGAETGEKLYDTLSVIGQAIGSERLPSDPSADLAREVKRWPVTLSYFEQGKSSGDAAPVYSIAFEAYENGVSRALVLSYPEFTVRGELTALEMKPSKPCP